MPRYLVNTVSIFRMTYIIDAPDIVDAKDAVVMNEVEDADQEHLDEMIVDAREISHKEFVEMLDNMANGHMGEKIVHKIDAFPDSEDWPE